MGEGVWKVLTDDDVGIGGFGLEGVERVQVAKDGADVGVFFLDEVGALLGATESGDLVLGVGVDDGVESLPADVSGCTGAGEG